MKVWYVALGLSLMLVMGYAGWPSRATPSSPDRGVSRLVVQTPHGPVEILEQGFGPANDRYPWQLGLWRQVSEVMRSRPTPQSAPTDWEHVHAVLRKFNYRLKPRGTDQAKGYDLFRGEERVLANIPPEIPAVAVSEAGDDFAFMVRTGSATSVLVRRGEVIPGDWAPDYAPIFVGRDLIALMARYPAGHVRRGQAIPWSVWREGKMVFTLQVPEYGASPKVKRLEAWGSHWVLEVDGEIYVDGKGLTTGLGARRVFEWRLINDKPFYFAEKEDGIAPSYGGFLLPQRYEEVVHYRCCEPATYNPASTLGSVSFWGRRRGDWYFVRVTSH